MTTKLEGGGVRAFVVGPLKNNFFGGIPNKMTKSKMNSKNQKGKIINDPNPSIFFSILISVLLSYITEYTNMSYGLKNSNNFSYRYDYWYQPYHNVMISTEWGHPR